MTTDQLINSKLSEILTNNFYAVELFEKYNFNYSLEGNTTLGKVCSEKKISPEKVIAEYNNLKLHTAGHLKFSDWSTEFLCDYIITNHHTYIKKIFPAMIKSAVYLGKKGFTGKGFSEKLRVMQYDFNIHMQKEEEFLFPHIKMIHVCEKNNEKYDIPPFGIISNPVRVMLKEHEIAYDNFTDLKKEFENFMPDMETTEKGEELYKMLREFETDLHLHFHFENNLLFPKAIKTEKKLIKNNSYNHIKSTKKNIK